MTNAQSNRVNAEWNGIAKESVATELIGGVMYAYGSELACLRLFHKFNSPKARCAFSQNMQTWFFALDCPMLVVA